MVKLVQWAPNKVLMKNKNITPLLWSFNMPYFHVPEFQIWHKAKKCDIIIDIFIKLLNGQFSIKCNVLTPFSILHVRSTTDTSWTGTRKAIPVNLL